MEAFLTLTNKDLDELGISNAESRRQILSAIRELNNSKVRPYCIMFDCDNYVLNRFVSTAL